jgi:hypothetical protein
MRKSGHHAEQEMKRQLPVGHHAERGHMIDRSRAEELGRDDRGHDGGNDERAEAFHRDGAEDNFCDEEGAGKRRVVGTRDARGRAASDEQPQPRGRKSCGAPEQRAEHGAELHHGTLAPDRATGGNGDE